MDTDASADDRRETAPPPASPIRLERVTNSPRIDAELPESTKERLEHAVEQGAARRLDEPGPDEVPTEETPGIHGWVASDERSGLVGYGITAHEAVLDLSRRLSSKLAAVSPEGSR